MMLSEGTKQQPKEFWREQALTITLGPRCKMVCGVKKSEKDKPHDTLTEPAVKIATATEREQMKSAQLSKYITYIDPKLMPIQCQLLW